MKTIICQKCEEAYPSDEKLCPVCNQYFSEQIPPRNYNMPLRIIFVWISMISMLVFFIAFQLKVLSQRDFNLIYLLPLAVASYFLVRMISLVRANLFKLTVTEKGITRNQIFPPSQKIFRWEDIKRFKFSTTSSGKGDTKIYVLESKNGDFIVFNSLFQNSQDLVERITDKTDLKLKKLKGPKGYKVMEKYK